MMTGIAVFKNMGDVNMESVMERIDNGKRIKISDICSIGYEMLYNKLENEHFRCQFFNQYYIDEHGKVYFAEGIWNNSVDRILDIHFVEPDLKHPICYRSRITAKDITREFMIPQMDDIYYPILSDFNVGVKKKDSGCKKIWEWVD